MYKIIVSAMIKMPGEINCAALLQDHSIILKHLKMKIYYQLSEKWEGLLDSNAHFNLKHISYHKMSHMNKC